MRQSLITFLLLISTIYCSGQSLFFDNLKNSIWTSSEKICFDSEIKSAREISLSKQSDKEDPKISKTMWLFGDDLVIRLYSTRSRCVSDISTHKYIVDKEKGTLKIILTDKITLTYKVGIVSTGNFALLIRQ
jgi:hypothetical protein